MGKIILYTLLASTGVTSLFRPWVGVVASYFIIILGPQYIWWWQFDGIRPIYWIMLPTVIGFLIPLLIGNLPLTQIKNKRILFQFILFVAFAISCYFGPYVDVVNQYKFHDAQDTFDMVLNIFILFFMGSICINSEKKLKYMTIIFLISIIYLTYWINDQYLFQGRFGRIGGPQGLAGQSTYTDENVFAMYFVVGGPFLYYAGLYCKKNIYRYCFWLIIPLSWHAIFLTGSRGGLVGLTITLLVVVFRSKKKALALALIVPLFVIAYTWQAGDVMKNRADTISAFNQERSAATRIEAWSAAISMMKAHPLTGVGLASFGQAFPDFSSYKPRQAHNTFFQISAESGVIAGTMYVLILINNLINLSKKTTFDDNNTFLFLSKEAIFVSMCGIIVCSLFLSLHLFEIFFFLCILANSSIFLNTNLGNKSNV